METWDYASVVGMMMYVSSNTRPDIQFAVHQFARFVQRPMKAHKDAIKRICRYLVGTKDKGITFSPVGNPTLECFVDADFAGLWGAEDTQDPVCVKSRTGFLLTFGGCPLLWVSKLQTEVALSTTEAEYIALSQAMKELLPTKHLLLEVTQALGVKLSEEATTYCKVFEDNQSCIAPAKSANMNPRTKHITIEYHFFRQLVADGKVQIEWIPTDQQKADILTKGLVAAKFEANRMLVLGW